MEMKKSNYGVSDAISDIHFAWDFIGNNFTVTTYPGAQQNVAMDGLRRAMKYLQKIQADIVELQSRAEVEG